MELSIFVAKILSIAYVSVGFGMMTGRFDANKMVDDLERLPALSYLAGVITLIMGMILVEYHNLWVGDWTVLITIVGWIALIKGILLIACPQFISKFKGWYKNTKGWGIAVILIGLMFGYFGFVA